MRTRTPEEPLPAQEPQQEQAQERQPQQVQQVQVPDA
jgi:hypothetical protein